MENRSFCEISKKKKWGRVGVGGVRVDGNRELKLL